jgi:hypothetical protein
VLGIRKTKGCAHHLADAADHGGCGFCLHRNVDIGDHSLRSWYMAIFILLPLIWMLVKLVRADTRIAFRRLSLTAKIIMLSGIISMLL